MNSIPLPHDSIITIDLPKMNIEAPPSLRKSYVVDAGSLSCSAIQNVDAGLECSFENIDSLNDRLTITGILPTGQSVVDTSMIIEIDSFNNPFSMTERLFYTTISTVSDLDGKTYEVQEGYTSFQATAPTSISNVEISSSDSTVQEYVTFTI
jgi:ABC-type amino acid transport substrate-binding protein